MFLHMSVIVFTGGMHGEEEHVWQRGTCIVKGWHLWRAGVHDKGGACVAKGDMHDKEGHAWQRGCVGGMHGKAACVARGVHAREMATEAGTTHPTGMHSCS